MKCQKCGKDTPSKNEKCIHCGHHLHRSSSTKSAHHKKHRDAVPKVNPYAKPGSKDNPYAKPHLGKPANQTTVIPAQPAVRYEPVSYPPEPAEPENTQSNLGLIIGLTIGGAVLLIGIILALVFGLGSGSDHNEITKSVGSIQQQTTTRSYKSSSGNSNADMGKTDSGFKKTPATSALAKKAASQTWHLLEVENCDSYRDIVFDTDGTGYTSDLSLTGEEAKIYFEYTDKSDKLICRPVDGSGDSFEIYESNSDKTLLYSFGTYKSLLAKKDTVDQDSLYTRFYLTKWKADGYEDIEFYDEEKSYPGMIDGCIGNSSFSAVAMESKILRFTCNGNCYFVEDIDTKFAANLYVFPQSGSSGTDIDNYCTSLTGYRD